MNATLSSYNHTHTIAALYMDPDQAIDAIEALRKEGFTDTSIRITHTPADIDSANQGEDPGFWSKLLSWFEGEETDTELYREGVRRGGSLITVHTSEDLAGKAINILDFYAPVDLEDTARQWETEGWQARDIGAEARITGDTDFYDRRDETLGNSRVRGFVRTTRDSGALG
jgi:hypothetical protein